MVLSTVIFGRMAGKIPTGLGSLHQLEKLDLSNNALTGESGMHTVGMFTTHGISARVKCLENAMMATSREKWGSSSLSHAIPCLADGWVRLVAAPRLTYRHQGQCSESSRCEAGCLTYDAPHPPLALQGTSLKAWEICTR